MAASLIGGLINKGMTASQISASEPGQNQRQYIEQQFQIRTYDDNTAHFGIPNVVIIEAKPQIIKPVMFDVTHSTKQTKHPVISVDDDTSHQQIPQP